MESINTLLNKTQEQPPHCKYCNTLYKTEKIQLRDGDKILREMLFYKPACTCEAYWEKIEAEKQQAKLKEQEEKARQERELEEKRIKAKIIFENSLMTPFFKEKIFENLEQTPEIKTLREYAKNFKPKESQGIQFIGNIGTGKTTALAALCNELMKQEYTCLFTTLSTLLDKFSAESYSNHGDITPLLNWLTGYDFIVIDDIGREAYTDKRKETAFRIIDTLLNNKVITAFTANPEMIEKLKKIPEWAATIDRLKEMCKLKCILKGESRRT